VVFTDLPFRLGIYSSPTWFKHNQQAYHKPVDWINLYGRTYFAGNPFRRQVLVGNQYIVDFPAPTIGLVVEIDGLYHARRVVADARRDRYLTRLGYRVLRLDSDLVLRRLAAAVERVREAIGSSIQP